MKGSDISKRVLVTDSTPLLRKTRALEQTLIEAAGQLMQWTGADLFFMPIDRDRRMWIAIGSIDDIARMAKPGRQQPTDSDC